MILQNACNKADKQVGLGTYLIEPQIPDTVTYYYDTFAIAFLKYNEKAMLGRVLFYDKHLSVNNAISCGNCHKQEWSFSDNVDFSTGYNGLKTKRNTLPLIDVGAFGELFLQGRGTLLWDGRESDVNKVVLRPVGNHIEMGIEDMDALAVKIANLPYYKKLFLKAYGDSQVTVSRLGESLGLFVKSIIVKNAKLDDAKRGLVQLSPMEVEGEKLFKTKYQCGECHGRFAEGYNGAEFNNIGLDITPKDMGRYVITQQDSDMGKFRLPNLDNIKFTAPYMHDGRFKTLDEVLDFYSTGIQPSAKLDHRLRDKNGNPVRMNITPQERQAIIAYLEARSDYTILTNPAYSNPFIKK